MPTDTCPGCRGTLKAREPAGVHGCSACGGVLIERSALKALGVAIPSGIARTAPRKPRHCGGCDGKMDTFKLSGITLDGCEECGSIYFDAGELDALRAARPVPAPSLCGGCGKSVPLQSLARRGAQLLCADCMQTAEDPGALQVDPGDYDRAVRHAHHVQESMVPGNPHYGLADDAASLLDVADGSHQHRHNAHRNALEGEGATGNVLVDVLLNLFR